MVKSREENLRRTPVVSSFPFFPGKERKLTGEASSTEESERIGIFPDAASSSGLHRLTMLAVAFLASEKIPMILSDNGRRGLTLQRKETAARLKFSCVPGCSDAQPCQCLRLRGTKFLFHTRYCPRKAARRIRAPLHLTSLQGSSTENFKQAGLLAPDSALS